MKSSHLLTRAQWNRFAERILASRGQAWKQGNWIGIFEADVLRAILTLADKPEYAESAFDAAYPTITNRELGILSPYECARHVWFRWITKSESPFGCVYYSDLPDRLLRRDKRIVA